MKKTAIISGAIVLLASTGAFGLYFYNGQNEKPEISHHYLQDPKNITIEVTKEEPTPTPTPIPEPTAQTEVLADSVVKARSFSELMDYYWPKPVNSNYDNTRTYMNISTKLPPLEKFYPKNFTPDRIENTFIQMKAIFDKYIMPNDVNKAIDDITWYLYEHNS